MECFGKGIYIVEFCIECNKDNIFLHGCYCISCGSNTPFGDWYDDNIKFDEWEEYFKQKGEKIINYEPIQNNIPNAGASTTGKR